MSYEQAPGTALLATHCCVCARPLLDARSVELGIGPECRKKHGFNEADADADWPAVMAELDGILSRDEVNPSHESRKAANVIVHRIACAQKAAPVPGLINALRALGFRKLATRIAERLCIVKIAITEDYISVVTPYSEHAVECLRRVRGRRWDRESKSNLFPIGAKPELWRALKLAFPGERGIGPDGIFEIPGRRAS